MEKEEIGYNMFNDKYGCVKSECLKKGKSQDAVVISIVIPTYKRGKYLEEAIDSAINQQKSSLNYEIVVINNDPVCDMKDIIAKYQSVSNLSIYRNEENIGMAGNINRCALIAKGKYIAYLHDDDLLKDNYIKKIEKILKKYDDSSLGSIVVNRNYLFMNKKDKLSLGKNILNKCMRIPFVFRYLYRNGVEKLTTEKVLCGWNKNYYLAPTCGTLFNREKMIELGLYDEKLYPAFDYVFFLQLNNKFKVLFVRDKLGIYRWDDNASNKSDVKIKTCLIRLRLINRTYKNKKCEAFFASNREVLNYIEVNKYDENERMEILRLSGLNVKPQKKSNILKFKLKNYCYRMINNLDY